MGISYPSPEKACYGQITLPKYVALLQKMRTDPQASNVVATENHGTVTYQKIDFCWDYSSATCELTLTIVGNHNWKAKLAGNQAIYEIINEDLISKL